MADEMGYRQRDEGGRQPNNEGQDQNQGQGGIQWQSAPNDQGQQPGFGTQEASYQPGGQGGFSGAQSGQGGYEQGQGGRGGPHHHHGPDQGQEGGQAGYPQSGQGGQAANPQSGQGGYDQGQAGYPQSGQGGQGGIAQPGYPQGGQGGIAQPGYPQSGQAAGAQPGYPQGGQAAYPQSGQGGVAQPGYPQGGQAAGAQFDLNDPQQRQQALQWLQQYQSGNTQPLPSHHDLGNLASGWLNQAQPQHVQEATTHAVQQMPPQQQAGFIQEITGFLQQHGISPQQAGVQTTNPQQMSPNDVGKLVGYAQQQNPDVIKQMFSPGGALSSPVVQVGLAGALAYAASRFLG